MATRTLPLRLTGSLLAASLAVGAASDAFAGPRAFHEKIGPVEELGMFVADCGTFAVLTDARVSGHANVLLDRQGLDVRAQVFFRYSDGIYYNSTDPSRYLLAAPSEHTIEHYVDPLTGGTVMITGISFHVKLPGVGPIFQDLGRLVFDLETGELLYSTGLHQFEGETAGLCSALSAP